MREVAFTFQVNASLKEQFITAAKGCERTAEQLLCQFMSDFVRGQHGERPAREVQAGVDPVNAGEPGSAEEVEAEAAGWREETRQKMDGSDS